MKTIKYVENTYRIKKRGDDWYFDGNDERHQELSFDDLKKIYWIDWETAVEGADFQKLREFKIVEVSQETYDEEHDEWNFTKVIGYYNPSHMIYYGSIYGWKPLKGEN